MPANVIEYDLIDRPVGEENFIWQYDFGQKIQFKNIDLPFSYEVHFANRSVGPAEKQLGEIRSRCEAKGFCVSWDPEVPAWIVRRAGREAGARGIRSAITREVVSQLAKALLNARDAHSFFLDIRGGEIILRSAEL